MGRFRAIGYRDLARDSHRDICVDRKNGKIAKMENHMIWDHGFRTCQGRGVTDYIPITFLVALTSMLVNSLVHTLSSLCEVVGASKRPHIRAKSCTHDMYRH
jgi:hypothetical protein